MIRSRSIIGRVLAATLVAAIALAVLTTSVDAAERRAGSVTVMKVDDPGTTKQSGSVEDRFLLKPPVRAACPGDSLNDDYRIQSFIVPAGDDPGALQYESVKPVGDGRWALYNQWGSRWVQKMTSPNSGTGSPGLIDESPVLTLAYFKPDQLPAGTYRVGLACTFENATTRYWDARIEFTPGDAATPGSWIVLDQSPYSAPSGSNWLMPLFIALLGFLVLFAGSFWLFSRGPRNGDADPLVPTDSSSDKELSS
jgi:hypothetical protein